MNLYQAFCASKQYYIDSLPASCLHATALPQVSVFQDVRGVRAVMHLKILRVSHA